MLNEYQDNSQKVRCVGNDGKHLFSKSTIGQNYDFKHQFNGDESKKNCQLYHWNIVKQEEK